MFTGLIETTAEIQGLSKTGLTVARPRSFTDVKVGSSIAVSGVCLTVTQLTRTAMSFDVVSETWKKTKLSDLKKGDRVNLERAMRAAARFEGHVVQGHSENTGTIANCEPVLSKAEVLRIASPRISNSKSAMLTIDIPTSLTQYVLPKGSICIDGVSLTVAAIKKNRVTVALVPHTLTMTTLGSLRKGDRVNIETDVLIRAVLSQKR